MAKDQKEWVVAKVLGPDEHSKLEDSVRVQFIHFEPAGIFGWILSGKNAVEEFLAETEQPEIVGHLQHRPKTRGHVQRTTLTELHRGVHKIPNPIVCLTPNDLILFKLNIHQSNRSLGHYPVYQKDHLFNTNSEWDFGSFRKLDYFIRETNVNITRFAHAFMEPGKFVFHDNAEAERTLIVCVSRFSAECDAALSVQPSSPFQLLRHGILKRQNLNLTPDWVFITGTLSVLAVMTAMFTVAALMLKPDQSSLNPMQKWKPKWRSLGEPYIPPGYVIMKDSLDFYEALGPRGAGEGSETEESTHIIAKRAQEIELEDFSVRTLFDKLEDQNLHLASQLNKQKSDLQAFYRHISLQMQELKDMLECLNPYEFPSIEGKWVTVDKLETTTTTNNEPLDTMKGGGDRQRLEELFCHLHTLVCKINSGHITISGEIIEKAHKRFGYPGGLATSTQDKIDPKSIIVQVSIEVIACPFQ
ncbi:uncharacterized protein LOC116991175 [Amblyraja radiata]|uniref:uncharacterized protein LOC116991175 n=1 Tax=Amblyraja radiata TaxID=386614 RepID=UPI001402FE7C|nr:uncharacterized protein LOC116991175 [Amblyraja radiata]